MKKIAIYYQNRDTLGHNIRLNSLSETLYRLYPRQAQVFLLNAGADQKFFRFHPRIIHTCLPFPGAFFDAAKERTRAMIRFIEKNQPDIFVTENFPWGNPESFLELLPTLRYLKKRSIHICGSSGYPYIAKEWLLRHKECLMLNEFYEHIYIHTPPRREDIYITRQITDAGLKENYRNIMEGYEKKIFYTGYILPEEAKKCLAKGRRETKGRARRPRVFVMRGAGAYFPALVGHAILAKKMLSHPCDMLIAAGPTTPEATMSFYAGLIQKNGIRGIRLERYIPDVYPFIRDCDVTCTMAGYNTSVLLMYYRKKSIVIPHVFRHAVNSEQTSRALMLKDYLGSTILNEQTVKARDLAADIDRLLGKNSPGTTLARFGPRDFDGGAATARFLIKDV